MKVLRIILLITGVALFLALAGCGGSGNDDGPEPPVDTVAVEPPDTVDVPLRRYLLFDPVNFALQKLECINVKFTYEGEDTFYTDYGMHAKIVGRWQMLIYRNGSVMYGPSYTDFSCRSVIYTFNADSTVTVVSDTTAIQSGTFKYTYPYPPFGSPMRIGEEEYDHCHVAEPILTLTPASYSFDDFIAHKPGVGLFFKIE